MDRKVAFVDQFHGLSFKYSHVRYLFLPIKYGNQQITIVLSSTIRIRDKPWFTSVVILLIPNLKQEEKIRLLNYVIFVNAL